MATLATGMDDDEKNRRFTVFLYTIHSNVYPTFNSALRERPPGARFDAWRPFLWHLMAVLRSLPDISRIVYRGIDTNDPRYHGPPLTDYKMSAKLHWSGFSSTTIEPSVARNGFAGVGGVVFIMKVHNAKDSTHCFATALPFFANHPDFSPVLLRAQFNPSLGSATWKASCFSAQIWNFW